jgi:hypothetical protein
MATKVQVVFDCADPAGMASFWGPTLGYKQDDPPPGFATWPEFLAAQGVPEDQWNSANAISDPDGVGPRIFFQRVPEPKTVKNRLHLDVNVGGGHSTPIEERRARIAAAIERLEQAGATKLREMEQRGEYWVVMTDPEGNEFCLQ